MSTNHVQTDEEAKPPVFEPDANGDGSPAVIEGCPPVARPFEPEKIALDQESAYYRALFPSGTSTKASMS